MRVMDKLSLRLRSLMRRKQVERELDREMRFHLDQQIEENLAAGMAPDEARRRALLTIGGIAQFEEECREMRGINWIYNLVQDLRYAARVLVKTPGFTVVAVISLALGIGANTAIFSVVDSVMLKNLPVENPERLVALGIVTERGESNNVSYPLFEQIRRRVPAFSGVFTAQDGTRREELSRLDGSRVADVELLLVSGEYFNVLGARPVAGRLLAPEDNIGAQPVAILSYRFWRSAFGGDPGVVGGSVVVKQQRLSIVGVAPPEFFGEAAGRAPDIWVPLMMQPVLDNGTSYIDRPNTGWLRVMARLRPGVTELQARAASAVFISQLKAEPGRLDQLVREIRELTVSSGARGLDDLRRKYSQPLRVLSAIVCLILLLACANVANLLLARGAGRHREIAIRLAIGAKRSRVIRQLMTENALLAALGGGLGLLGAVWGTKGLLLLVSGGLQPVRLEAGVDLRVLGFSAAISLVSSFLFGMLPALRATRSGASLTVTNATRRSQALARSLVVTQVTISVLLVGGAGLFVQTLHNLRTRDLGFQRERLVQAELGTRSAGYRRDQLPALYERLQASVRGTPGIVSVSMSHQGFTTGISSTCCIAIEGYAFRPGEDRYIRMGGVTPGYFETVSLPIILGRPFTPQDVAPGRDVAIINKTMAQRYYRGESPIGKRFGWGDPPKAKYNTEIVGVAEDANLGNLREEPRPLIYTPSPAGDVIQARTALNTPAAIAAVRQAIRRVDPNLWNNVQSIDAIVDRVLVTEKTMATLSGFFGIVALVLAGVGLYGLTSYAVARRTQEIGIRMALGANRVQIVRMVSSQVALLSLLGLAFGIPLTLASARLVSTLLFGVKAGDPFILLSVTATLACISLVAAFMPSRRAASVDPMSALRNE